MKTILCITFSFTILLTIAGCNATQPTSPVSDIQSEATIVTEQVSVTQESIMITGNSNLPDGTCILTKLVDDQGDLAWWPEDTCATVTSGYWEMVVKFGQDVAPNQLDPERSYTLNAYQKDKSDVQAIPFPFDFTPPQEAQEQDAQPTPVTEGDTYPAPQTIPTSASSTPYP